MVSYTDTMAGAYLGTVGNVLVGQNNLRTGNIIRDCTRICFNKKLVIRNGRLNFSKVKKLPYPN